MKKALDIIKPYLSIILGSLIFLFYLNNLAGRNFTLAIGIIAVVVALSYIALGVLDILAADKFSEETKQIFGFVRIGLFPLFIFLGFLFTIIANHSGFGPAGWLINIFNLIISLSLSVLYVLASVIPNKALKKLLLLNGGLFILVLLLNVLFTSFGNAITLGNLNILLVVIEAVYAFILVEALRNFENPKPRVKKEKPKKEPKKEEKKDEKPAPEEVEQEVVDNNSEVKEDEEKSEEEKTEE